MSGSYPVVELGLGKVEVSAGTIEDLPALIFSKHGTGTIGERSQREGGPIDPAETWAAITFTHLDSVDVVVETLQALRRVMEISECNKGKSC